MRVKRVKSSYDHEDSFEFMYAPFGYNMRSDFTYATNWEGYATIARFIVIDDEMNILNETNGTLGQYMKENGITGDK